MLSKLLWDCLNSKFQLELLTEEATFKQGNNHDGVKLWHQIVENVNPSTKVSVANLKDEIETANLADFGHNIKKFNQWFKDKRVMIIKEVEK
eukprot:1745368-Ditylum_brightwellii.AAC.1